MKRQLTEAQVEARDARRTKFRAMVKQIADMSAVQKAELSRQCGFRKLNGGGEFSLANSMLLALQCPHATILGGFREWLKHGRAVIKGQHGAMVWGPLMHGAKTEVQADGAETKDGEKVGFIPGTVFDISQTQEIIANAEMEQAA